MDRRVDSDQVPAANQGDAPREDAPQLVVRQVDDNDLPKFVNFMEIFFFATQTAGAWNALMTPATMFPVKATNTHKPTEQNCFLDPDVALLEV